MTVKTYFPDAEHTRGLEWAMAAYKQYGHNAALGYFAAQRKGESADYLGGVFAFLDHVAVYDADLALALVGAS